MNWSAAADRLAAVLDLLHPAVALSFVDDAPVGVPAVAQAAPSACTFWRRVEDQTFFAAADQHYNCPIGSMVMGFDLPPAVDSELGGLVQSMCDAQYIDIAEAAAIPHVDRHSAGIVYGPLREVAAMPDLVLVWIDLAHAMLFNEAAGHADWTAASTDVTGRPGCASLPRALASGGPALSFGCVGMRTFTDIEDDLGLAAIPGRRLSEFLDALDAAVRANAEMWAIYEAHKAAIGG